MHDCKCNFCVLYSLTKSSAGVLTAIVKPSATVDSDMCNLIASFLLSFNAATNNNCLHKSRWRYKWREQEERQRKMSLVKLNRDGPICHPRYINISKQCTWDCCICLSSCGVEQKASFQYTFKTPWIILLSAFTEFFNRRESMWFDKNKNNVHNI